MLQHNALWRQFNILQMPTVRYLLTAIWLCLPSLATALSVISVCLTIMPWFRQKGSFNMPFECDFFQMLFIKQWIWIINNQSQSDPAARIKKTAFVLSRSLCVMLHHKRAEVISSEWHDLAQITGFTFALAKWADCDSDSSRFNKCICSFMNKWMG